MSKNTKPHKTGSQIQSEILDYCHKHKDIFAVKIISANERGIPDILLGCRGMFVAIEVKGDGDTVKPIQQAQIDRIRESGNMAYIVHSFDEFLIVIGNVF